jgi:hypothetical protein
MGESPGGEWKFREPLRPLGGDFGNGPRAMISTPGVKTPGGGGSPKVERAGGKPGGKLKWQAGNGDSTAGVPKGAIAVEERKAAIRRRSLSVAHAGVPRRVEAQQEKDLLRGAEGDRPGKAECHAQARRAGRGASWKVRCAAYVAQRKVRTTQGAILP